MPAGIINGDFAISNPADPGYGWTTRGNASIANGEGILDEGTTVQTEFSQTFTIPTGTVALRFTIVTSNLVTNGPSNPVDAFEAALLNATTLTPLIGPPTGLPNTDSFLNIQQTGEVYYAPQVTVPGAGASGDVASLSYPNVITVDVSSIPANTQATLFFDLIGFSPATSSVTIDNVVTLLSTTIPTANDQSITTAQGSASGITLTGSDPNIPPLPLTYSVTTGPSHGSLSGTAPNLTYTPDPNYFGPDSFQFTDTNGSETSAAATVSIDVVGTPTANGQSLTTTEGVVKGITLTGTDPNTPPLALSYAITANPGHGTLSGTAPNLTYTPDPGYSGLDSFQFTDSNGTATSPAAPVSIDVIGAPVANAQSVSTAEGSPKSITLTGTDPNIPPLPLTYSVSTGPSHGSLSGTAPNLTYTPDPNYFGPDSFQFTDNNGVVTSPAATVSISVVGAPTANGQTVTTIQGSSSTVTLSGSDPNIPPLPLTYSVTTGPSHGSLSGTAPNLTYTPDPNYFGPDSFQFTDSNGVATSPPATVSFNIVGAPTANEQSVSTTQNTAVSILLSGSDPNTPPQSLTYSVTTAPSHGTLSGTTPNFTYLPNTGYSGADSFQFAATNSSLARGIATISITVASTIQPPVSHDESYTTGQNVTLNVAAPGILSNVVSPSLAPTAVLVTGSSHGVLNLNADGSFAYTPINNFTGADDFTYRAVADGVEGNVAVVHLTITAATSHLLLPDTPYYNSLRNRHAINPTRFDSYHPRLGALIELEINGIPQVRTRLVARNVHFNFAVARKLYGRDPAQFETRNPILGAIFQLETPRSGQSPIHLLPKTAQYDSFRVSYQEAPAQFSLQKPLLGALIELEHLENGESRST